MIGEDLLKPGDRVRRYEVVRELGRGGFGQVYEVRTLAPEARFALKLNAKDDGSGRFVREIDIMRALKNKGCGLPQFHEAGEHVGRRYFVCQLISGGNLERAMPIQPLDAIRILIDVTKHVERLHAQRVIHRDLKPSNILLEGSDVYLIDCGAAGLIDSDGKITKTADFPPMTPGFGAPELRASPPARPDPRQDVFSIGATFYYLLTGRPPPDRPTSQFLNQEMPGHVEVSLRKQLAIGDAMRMDAVVQRAIETIRGAMPESPASRWPMKKLQDNLRVIRRWIEGSDSGRILAGSGTIVRRPMAAPTIVPTAPTPPAHSPPPARSTRSMRKVWVSAGAATIVAVAGIALATLRQSPPPGPRLRPSDIASPQDIVLLRCGGHSYDTARLVDGRFAPGRSTEQCFNVPAKSPCRLDVRFIKAHRLRGIQIYSGAAPFSEPGWVKHGRPRRITVRIDTPGTATAPFIVTPSNGDILIAGARLPTAPSSSFHLAIAQDDIEPGIGPIDEVCLREVRWF